MVSLRQGNVPTTPGEKKEIKGKTDRISYLEYLEDQNIGISKRFIRTFV